MAIRRGTRNPQAPLRPQSRAGPGAGRLRRDGLRPDGGEGLRRRRPGARASTTWRGRQLVPQEQAQ